MKVTAILPDKTVSQVQKETKGKRITHALSIALTDWLQIRKTSKLIRHLKNNPLLLSGHFSASKVRHLNRS